MGSRTEKIYTCNQCGKEATDNGQAWIGGNPFSGWLSVKSHASIIFNGTPHKDTLFDFCGVQCMRNFDFIGGGNEDEST